MEDGEDRHPLWQRQGTILAKSTRRREIPGLLKPHKQTLKSSLLAGLRKEESGALQRDTKSMSS